MDSILDKLNYLHQFFIKDEGYILFKPKDKIIARYHVEEFQLAYERSLKIQFNKISNAIKIEDENLFLYPLFSIDNGLKELNDVMLNQRLKKFLEKESIKIHRYNLTLLCFFILQECSPDFIVQEAKLSHCFSTDSQEGKRDINKAIVYFCLNHNLRLSLTSIEMWKLKIEEEAQRFKEENERNVVHPQKEEYDEPSHQVGDKLITSINNDYNLIRLYCSYIEEESIKNRFISLCKFLEYCASVSQFQDIREISKMDKTDLDLFNQYTKTIKQDDTKQLECFLKKIYKDKPKLKMIFKDEAKKLAQNIQDTRSSLVHAKWHKIAENNDKDILQLINQIEAICKEVIKSETILLMP